METARWGESFSGDGPLADGVRKTGGVVGLLGNIPHPATRAGAMAAGSAAFAFTKAAEAAANLLPSNFVYIDFDLVPETLYADDERSGSWENVMVVAISKGWKLDRSILEGLLQFTQMKGGYIEWYNRFSPPAGLREALGNHLLTEAVNATIETHAGDSGILSIPPKETRPIDITDDPWSFGTVYFALQEEGRQGYRLNPAWEGELLAEVKVGTGLGKFGGRHTYLKKDGVIEPVRIEIQPPYASADPGETIIFVATVHARDKRVSIQAAQGSVSYEEQTDGTYQITYTAPLEEDGLPDTLTVRSESTGGLLADPSRRPSAQAFIGDRSPSVEVSPSGACLQPGAKQSFHARVENLANTEVSWTASRGQITQAGVYTAPSEPGSAVVTATSVANPSVSDSVTVTVGPCKCEWTLRVGGKGGSLFGVEADGALTFGRPGSLQGYVRGSILRSQVNEEPDEFSSLGLLPIVFSKFEASGAHYVVEGEISGTVYWETVADEGPEDERDWPGHLSLQFRGTMDPLGDPAEGGVALWCSPF